MLGLRLNLASMITQTARLARDLWNKVIDTWDNETRKWEDIVQENKMATGTLTGQTVANTYKSLLKVTGTTAGGETLGADTVIAIEDGDGNASSLSLSQQRATITLGSGAAGSGFMEQSYRHLG